MDGFRSNQQFSMKNCNFAIYLYIFYYFWILVRFEHISKYFLCLRHQQDEQLFVWYLRINGQVQWQTDSQAVS